MKTSFSIGLLLILLVTSCQKAVVSLPVSDVRQTSDISNITQSREVSSVNDTQIEEEKTWIPQIIKDCISNADAAEPIEIEDALNPYYLRADLDGNNSIDYAVLVRGVNDKIKRGLLICRDSKKPLLYGVVSKSKAHISKMSDDNFVSDDWEILTNEEVKELPEFRDGIKLSERAKGEVIGFYYEDGDFFIYWDGKTFIGI